MKLFIRLSIRLAIAVLYAMLLWLWPGSVVTFLIGLPICFWLACVVHETGHLLAYILLRLEWKRMQISFFTFERGRGLHVDLQQQPIARCTCAYHPHIPRWRYTAALLSGGLFCALLSAGSFLLAAIAYGSLSAFALCFAIACGVDAAVNLLIPLSPDRRLMRQIKEERDKLR